MTTPPAPSPGTDLRRVLESLPDPFFTLDAAWRFTFVNGHGAHLVGREPGELLGRVLWEVFPGTLGTPFEVGLRRARQEGRVVESEAHFAPLGRWLEVRAFPDGDGLGVHARDVTGRRLAAASAGALAGVARDLVSAVTPRDVAEVLTGEVCTPLGAYSAVLYLLEDGHLCETLRRGLTAPEAWRRFALHGPHLPALVARDREPRFLREADFRRQYPDAPRAERTRAAAVLPLVARGELLGVLAYSYDAEPAFDDAERALLLTLGGQGALALERARQAQAARDREERYRLVSSVMNDAIWDWQLGDDRLTWSDGVHTLFGYPRGEVEPTGQWWKDRLHPEDRARVVAGIEAVILGAEGGWRDEYRFRRHDGTYATVLDRGRVLRDERGGAVRLIGGMTDLSERERHRRELAALNASLERRVEQRTEELRLQAAELRAETDALSAFAAFTGAVGGETDLAHLAQRAVETLVQAFGTGSAMYYDRDGELWKASAWTGDLTGETLRLARQGFPLASLLPDPAVTGPLFVEDWGSRGGEIGERTREYGAAAFSPIYQEGELRGLLTAGLKRAPRWTPREQAVFRAVGHGLGLAAERAGHLRRLEEERAATAAFAAFTEGVGTETDPRRLARRAVDVLCAALEGVSAGYFELEGGELEGGCWKGRVLSPGLPPAVVEAATRGFAQEGSGFAAVARTRDVLFVEGWDPSPASPLATVFGAGAFFPYLVDGRPYGLLTMASAARRPWSARARAVFSSVARGLSLAFERAETARALQQQNAELHARTRALEGFADLARDLAFETDPAALVRRAQEIVLTLLPQGLALYYEPGEGRWRVRVQTGDVGNTELQAALDAGLGFEETGNLIRPWRTGAAYYQDAYAPETDHLPDQTRHIGSTAAVPIPVNGRPRGVLAVALFGAHTWDATDRAVLETAARHLTLALERAEVAAELGQQRAALQASNEELEAFSYTVSHDLRAPLRHIAGFSGVLRRAVEAGDPGRAARALDVIDGSVARAGALIDALLGFSHLSRRALTKTDVDLGRLLDSVRAEAEGEAAGREVQWVVGALPTVRGDPELLRQVLANLLANAVKYSARSEQVRVEVGHTQAPGETVVFVRDSGAGFDPRYADRLFGVFQRLHHAQEFQGTGIGLATVRRIVQRHGGRVWAEGQPGQGATFSFSLPRA